MPHHLIGWTFFACGHETSVKVSSLQHLQEHYKREYLSYQMVDTSGKEFYAQAPRPCKACLLKKQQKQPAAHKGYENFEQRWRTEWAPKIAAASSPPPSAVESEQAPLRNLLHHVCPHLRSVYKLKEEVLLRRVNSQLKLEGLDISEDTRPADFDQEKRRLVTRVVEDQLHMHRHAKLKRESANAKRDSSVLREAEVAVRSAGSAKVVHMVSKSKQNSVAGLPGFV